mmetsp:Transcript_27004/g.31413  ORF Transcript_27004/g.31413 Transcript_27004/m.31413 type:complete len:294 (+) Transcript_27004:183-1064(+)
MRVSSALILVQLAYFAEAFSPVGNTGKFRTVSSLHAEKKTEITSFDPLNLSTTDLEQKIENHVPAMTSLVALLALTPEAAYAAPSPDWGLFEGKTGSLLHPITMGSMFLLSVNTALKGFSYRRQRTMGDEISAMRKTLPDLGGASSLPEAITAAREAEDFDLATKLTSAMPIQNEINALVSERKELSSMGLKDKHFSQGAMLAFLGTAFAIEGPLNTYARAGKLFPGPHLYAGAGLVVLWALAAACVPAMQKGSDTARSVHIGANVTGMGLFAWQIVSGWPILTKVYELTKWP